MRVLILCLDNQIFMPALVCRAGVDLVNNLPRRSALLIIANIKRSTRLPFVGGNDVNNLVVLREAHGSRSCRGARHFLSEKIEVAE